MLRVQFNMRKLLVFLAVHIFFTESATPGKKNVDFRPALGSEGVLCKGYLYQHFEELAAQEILADPHDVITETNRPAFAVNRIT